MSTSVGAGEGIPAGFERGSIGVWLRLFLGISAGAVLIAVTLGLVVVLTAATAQAQTFQATAPVIPAAAQLLMGVVMLAAGFLVLLSRRGSRLLAPRLPAARLQKSRIQ